MKTVGSYESQTHLPRLLDEVARREEITITRRRSESEAIKELPELREGVTLGEGLTIRRLVDEGRLQLAHPHPLEHARAQRLQLPVAHRPEQAIGSVRVQRGTGSSPVSPASAKAA